MIMRNLKRKRLNNKGFTLIELLAVVVILAVVMGIATTSVLTAMNKSRGGALTDSAMVIVNGFNQKYTESLVGGIPSAVYKVGTFDGYDFTADSAYYLDPALANEFNISTSSYNLQTKAAVPTTGTVAGSFVAFDADNGKYLVCLVAASTGNVHVAGFAVGGANANGKTAVTFDSKTYTFATGQMFSCTDGTTSW